jgi:hypothetical protein
MKLKAIYSDDITARLNELETMLTQRKNSISSNLPNEFNALAVPAIIRSDDCCQQIKKEIARLMSISLPIKYELEK